MQGSIVSAARSGLLVAAFAGFAGAATTAGAQAQCDVNESTPAQVSKAFLAVTMAQQQQTAGKTDDAAKQLQAAVKGLTEAPDKIKNPLGRQLVLGRALAVWAGQPGMSAATTRGALGYVTDPAQPVDLHALLDSTLTAIETAQPACVSETVRLRANKTWLGVVNAAIEQANSGTPDSAAALAQRSLLLYRGAPYGEMVLGNMDFKRGRITPAMEHYRKAIEVAATDTAFAEQHRSLMLQLGNVAAGVADTAKGADKQRWSREAVAAYEQLVAKHPNSPEASAASGRMAEIRLAVGDTAAAKAAYAEQLASPEKFGYQALLTAGVNASRAGQAADAAKLFDHVLKANPNNRDALYNAALVAHDRNEFAKSLAYLDRLVQVDPGNDQGWLLFAHNYAKLNKGAKTQKLANAYKDSVSKYLDRSQNLPYQVKFTEWSNAPEKTTLRGTVKNTGKAAKSFAMTVEFLDATGAVVETKPVAVANVAPGAEGAFTAETTSAKAVAFRYKVE
jgi:tetratricopeptide (TPR) repeat protein